jgi:hypothetical protein
VITKPGNLAMGRQSGVKHRRQFLVKAIQYTGMGKNFAESGVAVLQQRLDAFALETGFF